MCTTGPAPGGKKTSIGNEPPSGQEIRILTPPTRGSVPAVNSSNLEAAPALVPGLESSNSRSPF